MKQIEQKFKMNMINFLQNKTRNRNVKFQGEIIGMKYIVIEIKIETMG